MNSGPPSVRMRMSEVLAYLKREYGLEINPHTVRNWAGRGRQGVTLSMVPGQKISTNRGLTAKRIPATFSRADLDEFLAAQGVNKI